MTDNIDIKIDVDGFELIHSGILNLFSKSFKLTINNLIITFSFENKTDVIGIRIIGKPVDDKSLNITFVNLSNSLLEGFFTPLSLGTLNGKNLYMNFSGWTVNDENHIRSLAYNIFIREGE